MAVIYGIVGLAIGGFGEILLMIAVMVALQSELVWRRARPLGPRSSHDAPGPAD